MQHICMYTLFFQCTRTLVFEKIVEPHTWYVPRTHICVTQLLSLIPPKVLLQNLTPKLSFNK
ncbi:hypothetical protein Lalb_Chr13g0304541 [Lupinus albus]|uniref:Uncharacterized protein n=1 Tax=Lupinus albus TaxID=3870 RepID=A0A6A4PKM8_LUPAL|nr:hypothetical protein Lalb_Chr13g0304541 [Lupinus albus]